jgi:hypothetical protein
MKRTFITLAILVAVAPAFAGVVYQVETRDLSSSPAQTSDGTISAQGMLLKMQIQSADSDFNGEMIFRGDRREMVIVNHDEKTVVTIDEATMLAMADQISQAMAAMEQALAAVPASQRKKMEEMMKSRMPMQAEAPAPAKIRATGDADTINGYPATRYEVWRGDAKERELWVTEWSNVEGGDEVAGVFREMAGFMQRLLDSLPNVAGIKGAGDTAFAYLEEMKGFPVMSREFGDGGRVELESVLTSSEQKALDAATFEPPKGYKEQDLKKMMGR